MDKSAVAGKILQVPTIRDNKYLSYQMDILIPFYGQYQRVYQLCQAIWRSLGNRFNYQICLIDDCSPNAHFINGFAKAPRTTCVRNGSQLGFGGALNAGFKQTSSPWIVIMHSDAMPSTQLWLGQLIDSFNVLQSHNVAMVSPRTNNPGEGCSSLLKGSKDNPGEDVVLKEGHLPLYCALCPRAIFNRIGGFIKEYPFGWYETDELAYRMRKFGCFQGVSGASWIRHMGEATFIDLWRNNPQSKQVMESNHERCVEDMRRLGKI